MLFVVLYFSLMQLLDEPFAMNHFKEPFAMKLGIVNRFAICACKHMSVKAHSGHGKLDGGKITMTGRGQYIR